MILKYFSKEINNAKRVVESLILHHILSIGKSSFDKLNSDLESRYNFTINQGTFDSALNNLKLNYVTENHDKKLKKVAEIYNLDILDKIDNKIYAGKSLASALQNNIFKKYLLDDVLYGIHKFETGFNNEDYVEGFLRYRKYSRKDCFRILNWDESPLAQNVGGYMFHNKDLNCPIFVNYHKEEDISETTKYEDGFIDPSKIIYMSKSKRKLTSPDVIKFAEAMERNIRLPLFIKKENAEGDDFYFIGDVNPLKNSFVQTTMGEDKKVSVVKMTFCLDKPVEPNMYNYITKDIS